MFQEITIKNHQSTFSDIGQLAECLLFYKKVNLICGVPFFKMLIEKNEIIAFFELVKIGNLSIHLEDNIFGLLHQSKNGVNSKWTKIVLTQGQNVSLQDRLQRVIFETTKKTGYTRRLTNRILNASEVFLHEPIISEFVNDDFKDEVYIKRVISKSISHYNPSLNYPPEKIEFRIEHVPEGFIIETNLDLKKISDSIKGGVFDNLTIIRNLVNARADSKEAGDFNSEMLTSPLYSEILKEKFDSLILQAVNKIDQIDSFSSLVFREGKSIRGAINSGEKSLTDFIEVLEKSTQFKNWLNGLDNNEELVKEYFQTITNQTWVDKLPGKSFRWSYFTAAGLLIDAAGAGGMGTAAGLALSAGDAFLLDKLIKGWQPNSFVNKEMLPFVKK